MEIRGINIEGNPASLDEDQIESILSFCEDHDDFQVVRIGSTVDVETPYDEYTVVTNLGFKTHISMEVITLRNVLRQSYNF